MTVTSVTIEAFLTYLTASGAPATTRATRRSHLMRAERCLGDLLEVDGPTLVEWCGGQAWAVETRRGYRGTLRAFYTWAVGQGLCEDNAGAALPRVRPARPTPKPAPDAAYRAALAAARPRERLMLRLAAEGGLRRAEVAGLHARDLTEDLTGRTLRVTGKGGRQRLIPLTDSLAADVAAASSRGGYLFPGAAGGHLSPRWVGKIVGGLLPEGVTMHALRHRFGTKVYRATRDVFVVQDLLGHASPVTTRTYVVVETDSLRSAVEAAA